MILNFYKQAFIGISLLFTLIQANGQAKQKCFENDGLKYKTVVTINFLSATQVNGTVTSGEYDAETTAKADFTGTINNKTLKIKFKGTPPTIGDATQWTNKPWVIKKTKGKETLCIIFYSKNYETNKWSNTTYKLEPCQ